MKNHLLTILALLAMSFAIPVSAQVQALSIIPEFAPDATNSGSKISTKGKAQKRYYANGALRAEGRMLDEKRIGSWSEYFQNGQRRELGQYQKGKRVGIWTFWNENGKFDRIEEYSFQGFTHEMEPNLDVFQELLASGNWQAYALAASYALEYGQNHVQGEGSIWFERALELIEQSQDVEQNYENMVIKTRILERINFQQARNSAAFSISMGKQRWPNFEDHPDYLYLSALMDADGC